MCNRISVCWLFFFSHIKGFRIAIIRQQEKLKTARKHLRKLATRDQSDWKSVHCYNNMRKIVVIFELHNSTVGVVNHWYKSTKLFRLTVYNDF